MDEQLPPMTHCPACGRPLEGEQCFFHRDLPSETKEHGWPPNLEFRNDFMEKMPARAEMPEWKKNFLEGAWDDEPTQ